MAFNMTGILSGIQAAATAGGAVSSLINSVSGLLGTANSVMASVQAKFRNIMLNSDNSTMVIKLCNDVLSLDNIESVPLAILFAEKISAVSTDSLKVMSYASSAISMLNQTNTAGTVADQLGALSGHISQAVGAKPSGN